MQADGWVSLSLDAIRMFSDITEAIDSVALSSVAGKLVVSSLQMAPPPPELDSNGQIVNPAAWAGEYVAGLLGEGIREALGSDSSGHRHVVSVFAVDEAQVDNINLVDLAREIDPGILEVFQEAQRRVVNAAQTSPEFYFGFGDTNRWNGSLISMQEYLRYHAPDIEDTLATMA